MNDKRGRVLVLFAGMAITGRINGLRPTPAGIAGYGDWTRMALFGIFL
jgi:hypothetical protein